MNDELTVREGGQVAVVGNVTPMHMLEMAVQKGVDIEQLQKLLELQERWERNESRKAYNAAFAAFKAEAVVILKNVDIKDGPLKGKKYADLFGVVDAATPMLSKHGLAATWKITKDEKDWIEATCTLTHKEGHSESASFGGPPDAGGAKNAIQARASTLNYCERYSFLAVTGLAAGGTDDDGNGGPKLGADITPERRKEIQELSSRMKAHLSADSVADAVLEGEQFGLEGPDEWSFMWSFFDAKQRAAMKKAADASRKERAAQPITDAQRKRLEARISELKLDRDAVKARCLEFWKKEHFADLSKLEYDLLDRQIDAGDFAPVQTAEHTAQTASSQPAASSEAAAPSSHVLVNPDHVLILEDTCNRAAINPQSFWLRCTQQFKYPINGWAQIREGDYKRALDGIQRLVDARRQKEGAAS